MNDNKINIMIADSNEDRLGRIKDLLAEDKHRSFKTASADSCALCIDKISYKKPHLIFLSMNLDDAPGLDSIFMVKSEQVDVPIIAIVNQDSEYKGLETVKMGAQDYIVPETLDSAKIWKVIDLAIERQKRINSAKTAIRFTGKSGVDINLVKNLDKIISSFSDIEDFHTLITVIKNVMENYIPSQYLGVYLYDEESDRLVLIYTGGHSHNEEEEETEEINFVNNYFARIKKQNNLDHEKCFSKECISTLLQKSGNEDFAGKYRLWLPIMCRNECVGICGAGSRNRPGLSAEQSALLSLICSFIGVAYKNILAASERKRSKEKLAASEAYFRSLIQYSSDVIVITDEKGMLKYVSPSVNRVLGYEPEELINKCFLDYYHPDDLKDTYELYDKFVHTPQLTASSEFRIKNSVGSWCYMEATVSSYLHDPVISGVIFNARDITRRKKAQMDLQLFKTMIERAVEAITITDSRGVIRYVNPAFEKDTGYSVEQAAGNTPEYFLSSESAELFRSIIKEDINKGKTWVGRLTGKKSDGSCYEEDATVFPVLDNDGNTTNFVIMCHDASEKILLENQLLHSQKMEAVGRLAGGIAHDFNNLLVGILGSVEIARLTCTDDNPLFTYMNEIEMAAERASNLVRQLLTFSRKQIISPKVININNIIMDLEKMIQRIIGENIDFSINLNKNIKNIKADPGQLEQVIMNLVVNAKDAMPNGGRLSIETEMLTLEDKRIGEYRQIEPGEYVTLSVTDTGVGIDEETASHIFEPFFTTKEGKGTGLGLSTVYGIVKQAKGYIIPSSALNQGTTIKICLPVAAEKIHYLKEKSEMASSIPRGSEKILVVEDELIVRNNIEKLLSICGYDAIFASRSSEALELINQGERPDLLIVDLVLPDINGRDLAEQIKRLIPSLKVLYMSGYSDDVIARYQLTGEEGHFISKPFSVEDLLKKIRQRLDDLV